jgi:Flp pilus assembly protein TadD
MMDSRAEKLWQRGMLHFRQGNTEAAQANFEAFLAREPNSGPGRFRLSMVLARRGRHEAAVVLLEEMLRDGPEQIEPLAHLARCQLACGRVEAARATVLRAMSLPRDSAVVLDALATVMTRLDEQAIALELFDQAVAIDPAQASMYFNRALARRQFGLAEGAEDDLRTCLALHPTHAKAHWMLSGLVGGRDAEHRDLLSARLESELPAPERELTALALFRERDAAGEHEGAWAALRQAMAARAPRAGDSPARIVDALVSACDERFLRAPAGGKATFAPIFVFGMPQAGSALLGNLLSRHARVQHLGHLPVFSRLLSHALGRDSQAPLTASELVAATTLDLDALGRAFRAATEPAGSKALLVCESRPMNHQLAGLIARALPGARMLHVRRDPRDTCLSLLAQPGGDAGLPTHSPAALADACLQVDRLMRHWHAVLPGRMMDIDYESLVAKPDMVLRVICSFLGIRYGASLRMGLSLHARSVGRAARYAQWLPELESGLVPLYRESRSA